MLRELVKPPEVTVADNAIEIMRAWLVDGALQVSLMPSAFDDKAAWGILLADIAHHIADALAESRGYDRGKTIAAIVERFNREIAKPTDQRTGEFVPGDRT